MPPRIPLGHSHIRIHTFYDGQKNTWNTENTPLPFLSLSLSTPLDLCLIYLSLFITSILSLSLSLSLILSVLSRSLSLSLWEPHSYQKSLKFWALRVLCNSCYRCCCCLLPLVELACWRVCKEQQFGIAEQRVHEGFVGVGLDRRSSSMLGERFGGTRRIRRDCGLVIRSRGRWGKCG